MASIAELLRAARRRSFVGREQEIALFERFFRPDQADCVLLYLYGPGGQGKTIKRKNTSHFKEIEGSPINGKYYRVRYRLNQLNFLKNVQTI